MSGELMDLLQELTKLTGSHSVKSNLDDLFHFELDCEEYDDPDGLSLLNEKETYRQMDDLNSIPDPPVENKPSYDATLNRILSSPMRKEVDEQWLTCLHRMRNPTSREVAYMKLAGFSAKDIANRLDITVEEVDRFERRLVHHYHRIQYSLATRKSSSDKRKHGVTPDA